MPSRRPAVLVWMLSVAALLLSAACSGLTPAENERLRAFDFYWQRLADDYPLFGDQQLDWNELRRRYRAAVPFAQLPHEFYHLLSGMLSELGDRHVSLEVPPERFAQAGIAPTSLLDVDGFEVMPIEGRLHVVAWPPTQAPPAPEGLRDAAAFPEIVRVNGFPVVLSLVGNLLQGPPHTAIELHLGWRNGVITRHVMRLPAGEPLRRATPFAHLDARGLRWMLHRQDPSAWIELLRFDDSEAIRQTEAAIERARQGTGLVLDLRRNLGGRMTLAKQVAEHFLREPVEMVVVPRHPVATWFGLLNIEVFVSDPWTPREPRFDKPLVVLTSALTGSAAEHLARILQRYAGAIVIGERTAGAEAAIQTETGPDGAKLRFGSMRIVDRTGVGLQREGVVPDVSVRLTLDDLDRLGPAAAVADWDQRLAAAATTAFARQQAR